ncbi:MAG: iron-sulfur cluster assembly accessory protein [Gammaproteobacteria bacterium]|jgi:iron-sulfur cluster assembly protein|nr:iron-sulfur cluster assembly accessory protein [Gammaproteobacteria bacterium]
MIEITLAAAQHFQKQLHSTEKLALALKVKRSGCSGLSYDLSLIEEAPDSEAYISVPNPCNVLFYLEKQSAAYLKGLKIDFKTEGLQHRLVYINPNESGQCGCGESFSV